MNMTININDIEVKIKLLKSDMILAQVTIILFGIWEEKGWKVLKSNRPHKYFNDYFWIQAPSYRSGSVWKDIVFVNDEPLYRDIENKVYKTYIKEKEKLESLDNDSSKYEFTEEDEKKLEEMNL